MTQEQSYLDNLAGVDEEIVPEEEELPEFDNQELQ